jgi:hypothetical protein
MLNPSNALYLALLAFGVSAFLATRLRLGVGEKGGTRYASDWFQLSQMKTEAARGYINRLLRRMGWVWVLICAPLLAYRPEGGLDLKVYGGILAGCLMLGIILSAVTYSQVENFESVDVDGDVDQETARLLLSRLEAGGNSPQEVEQAYTQIRDSLRANAQKAAVEKARGPLRRSNRITLALVVAATALIPVVNRLAAWGSGLGTTGYVVLVVASVFVLLIVYVFTTQR